ADWKTYSNDKYGFEIKYPSFDTDSKVETYNSSEEANLKVTYLDKSDNNYKESFDIDVSTNPKNLTLSQWFESFVDVNSALLSNGSFKLQKLESGGEMYVLDKPFPANWDGGPVSGLAYIMSPDKKYVFSLAQSQDGIISVQDYLPQILSTFKFTSQVADTSNWK